MLLFKKVLSVAVAGGLTLAASQPAQAAPITATGSVAVLGVSYNPTGLIAVDTTFMFALSAFAGGTGDLAGVPIGSPLVTNQITATVGTPVIFSAPWGMFAGNVIQADDEGDALNRVVDVIALGTFTPLSGPPDLSGFDPGPMSLTFSATQTGGPNSSVSASYTIASPPSVVPEPLSMTLLGLGLAGSAFVARRRRS